MDQFYLHQTVHYLWGKGIKRRKPDLTVIEGHLKSQSMEQMIIDQLQLFIEKNLEKKYLAPL